MVRPYSDDDWKPKIEADSHIVPVYLKLIEAGVLALKEPMNGPYLISGETIKYSETFFVKMMI